MTTGRARTAWNIRVQCYLRWNRTFYTTQLLDSRVTVVPRSRKDNHHHLGLRVKMFSNESQVGFSSVISEFKHCRLKHLILQTTQSITSKLSSVTETMKRQQLTCHAILHFSVKVYAEFIYLYFNAGISAILPEYIVLYFLYWVLLN